MLEPLQWLLGGLVLLSPGFAITWAFAPGLDAAKFVAAGVIVALSIQPATMYVLNIFLGVPFTPMNVVLLCLSFAGLAAAAGLGKRLDRSWS